MIGLANKKYTVFILLLFYGMVALGQSFITNKDIYKPVQAKNGMVVTSEYHATEIGVNILQNGGNAVDAAVAVAFALAVTLPRAGNIGGGGFMLIYLADTGSVTAIDYREKAPSQAHRDMFLDASGNVDTNLSRFHHLSTGVPGTVAGLAMAIEKFGTIQLIEIIQPAIQLAEQGFVVSQRFSDDIKEESETLKKWKSSRNVFFKPDGSFFEPGDLFIQKDMAKTLRKIAAEGSYAFYQGDIADLIVQDMKKHNGFITKQDLQNYRPIIRKPVKGTYRGYDIFSMPPPSSGGAHIIQILNMLERYDIHSTGHNTVSTIHLMAEAMKRAFADRSEYMGDPEFFDVPIEGILSKKYAEMQTQTIDRLKATKSKELSPGKPPGHESTETTHFCIVDKNGNVVSNTYTINLAFGSGIVVEGAGFLLNDQMDDFSAKPGAANYFGLIGGDANAIEPGKRMLSSMSPTIVLKDGKPFLVTGSRGGSKIITSTLQVIVNVIDHRMNIQEAVNASRIHHQWYPEEIRIEEGISKDTITLLEKMGHTVTLKAAMGTAPSILIDQQTGIYYGAADPRKDGTAKGY